ncbi:AraC family transcriptional regulator [Planotetraspora thailandica]|uniref:AraC family transcriptional regulator n=1 Tax=Planotetraspora thailandica TaxID=487172 RepID=UPI001EF1ECBD|nr:AraC family transcriptional regulator [Planotetraspora thailandica]
MFAAHTMTPGAPGQEITAWRPHVDGVTEVFHARTTDHAYPMHTHESWTLLIVDAGVIRYDLSRHEHGALNQLVTLLPPHVPHNGCPVTPQGFCKRVVYLDSSQLGDDLIGHAVDGPALDDPPLRERIHRLHAALARRGDELDAESRLAFVVERLREHLRGGTDPASRAANAGIAHRLRELLDARFVEGVTLNEASALLHAHPTHLVRMFSRTFGMGPHRYLIGRRVDLARRLMLGGMPLREVAGAAGFHDQPHFTRHFKRVVGTSPGLYARSGAAPAG